jgi:hypothetical protein
MDGISGTTLAAENGCEIWHVECQEPLQDRLIEKLWQGSEGSIS